MDRAGTGVKARMATAMKGVNFIVESRDYITDGEEERNVKVGGNY
jgi:hypothetical protein